MADAAAARREARRRRILQNSQNRLQYISGKVDEQSIKAPPTEEPLADLNIENISPLSSSSACSLPLLPQYNGVIFPDPELNELLANETIAAGDHEVPLTNDLAAFAAPTPEVVQEKSFFKSCVSYKYDVVVLSLLYQILYSLWLDLDGTYFFLPLVVYTVTKSIWLPEESKSGIASVFLLMNGVSAQRASKMLYVTQWFSVLFKDINVYLFVTICVQSLIFCLKSYLFT